MAILFSTLVFPACSWWQDGSADSLKLYGNIELTQVDMAFKIAGKLSSLAVGEGDAVTQGMVVARLDTLQLESQRSRDQAALAVAESLIPQLQTSIERQKTILAAETDLRRAQIAQAEARLQELLAGSRSQEIQQAKALVDEARSQHQQAQQDWERAQTLYRNDDISTAQYDLARTRFASTAAALQKAEEQLALVQEGPRKEQIEAARAQVAQAQANLQLTEASRLELKRLE